MLFHISKLETQSNISVKIISLDLDDNGFVSEEEFVIFLGVQVRALLRVGKFAKCSAVSIQSFART